MLFAGCRTVCFSIRSCRCCLPPQVWASVSPPPPLPSPPPPQPSLSAAPAVASGLYYRFSASSFQPDGSLLDLGPSGRTGSYQGTVATAFDPAGSFGVSPSCPAGGVWYAAGSSAANATFGPAPGLPPSFSYCLLARYTGPNKGRVVTSDVTSNWAIGHYGGKAGE